LRHRIRIGRGDRSRRARLLLSFAWPVALGVWIFAVAGRIGFSPLDEGFIASQSRRILMGDVPHRDFISPKPVGSALIHLVDLAVPLPLFTTVRLMGLVEFIAYSLVFAALIFGRPPWRWSAPQSIGAAGSVLVNINAWPLMSWPTMDGLLAVAVGFALVRAGVERDLPRYWAGGLVCLGAAVFIKQSFVLAPLIGLIYVYWTDRRRAEPRRARRRAIGGLALVVLPGFLYVAVIAALGGLDEMVTQFGNAPKIYGRPIVYAFTPHAERTDFLGLMAALAAVTVLTVAIWRLGGWERPASPRARGAAAAHLALTGLFAALVLWVTLDEGLIGGGKWGLRVMWVLGAVLVLRALLQRRIDREGFVVLAVAYMATLALGLQAPNLVTGTVVLFLFHRVFAGAEVSWEPLRRLRRPVIAVAITAAAVATAVTFVHARERHPYFDRPESGLTASLGGIAPDFDSLRTNPVTAEYLRTIKSCLDRYPASSVAVLPDNPSLYVVFDLHNPFPVDWMWPPEYKGSEQRIRDAASRLSKRGGYLVLFQAVSGFELYQAQQLPKATKRSIPYWHVPEAEFGAELLNTLHGKRITCGSFVGAYDPRRHVAS
jgi:hypothetical protein